MTLPQKRRRRPLPSAEAIAGNEDLMTEILIRLPAKSLCRFKSVSKRWNSLISHPRFSLLRVPKSVSGFFLEMDSSYPSYKYFHLAGKRTRSAPFKSLTFADDDPKIIHSCNGLLLCSSTCIDVEIGRKNYYIYNPTTKHFANIPPPPLPCVVQPFRFEVHVVFVCQPARPAINLAFDPSRAPHYKIVLVRPRGALNFQIEIYSSETRTWRPSGDPFPAKADQGFTKGVFLNGMIHWVSTQSETSLRFDVERECLETMPMPPIQDGEDERTIGYFGESRGHLHLICGLIAVQFDVLEMESDYSKWFVKYRVDLEPFHTTFPDRAPLPHIMYFDKIYICSALHLFRGEREEESFLVLHIPCMVICYNFKDKTIKKLCNLEMYNRAEYGWLDAHPYVETLSGKTKCRHPRYSSVSWA